MTPAKQLHDKDCLRACIATLLDLNTEQVPDFCATEGDEWYDNLQGWLAKRNLCFAMLALGEKVPWYPIPTHPLAIFVGFSQSGINHTVVGRVNGGEFTVVHDPHPNQGGIDAIDAIAFLVPLDPTVPYAEPPRERPRILRSTILPPNGRFPRR